MRKIYKYFLVLFSISANAQMNLVPNPSFEDTLLCPIATAQINRASGWSSYRQTPDYFNSCNTTQVGVPLNSLGYQNARTGNAYAGLATRAGATNFREIIGAQLSQILVIGKKYIVEFYVSRVFNPAQWAHIDIATNKLGARFSTVPNSYTSPIPIDNFSQIYSDSLITDTNNWVQISGQFIADSAYQYISIGNFFTDSATTYIKFDSLASAAYYFVDDISVIADTANGINDIYSSNQIKIFPNPARDWIAIEGRNVKSIVIFDILGRTCIENNLAISSPNRINVSSLSRGIYFIQINTFNKSFITKIILD